MTASDNAPEAVKILISGGFGVGKTSMVSSVSEITPLRTEEVFTERSIESDDLSAVELKATTTVAMDFGRITLADDLVLYMFGTPGQERFWHMWDDMLHGALGGIVLVDTRRLESSFFAVDFFEERGLPFIVAVNCFYGQRLHTSEQVGTALALAPNVRVETFDARHRTSCLSILLVLLDELISLRSAQLQRGAAKSAPGMNGQMRWD
ncbi:ATP/GTP-binding protein [Streptomyces sp. NPDC051776]|uniref:GTP-binding protein n=1 Tax=Streptomyces sp. NPDC051776 TaxID=3155414 RepID=UPI0034387EF1